MHAYLKTAVALAIACLFAATGAAQDLKKLKVQDLKKLDVSDKTKANPIAVKGIDPAVTSLNFVLKKKLNQFEARIDIVGVVKNIGTDGFHSHAFQAAVRLYEHVPGMKPRQVFKREINNLKSGESIEVVFSIARWKTSNEFPPDYTLQIDYDPDILSDGNRHNDDVNWSNNRKTLQGTTISQSLAKRLAAAK